MNAFVECCRGAAGSLWRGLTLACLLLTIGQPRDALADREREPIEPITTERVVEGLREPTFMTYAPDDYKRLYVLERRGVIKIVNLYTGEINAQPFLDIEWLVGSDFRERGLLGLAFHPDFKINGYFYVNYTNLSGTTKIVRLKAITPDQADVGSRITLITIQQPFMNHNGGWLAFGPNDGYLYVGTGDGGDRGDPGNRAQTTTNQLLGKILRYDMNSTERGHYGIPPSNPFVGIDGDDDIWAYGLRHPWRSSFDRETGDLYIADVGQDTWEEINFQPAASPGGENYGWRCREGMHDYLFEGDCERRTFVDPIHDYDRSVGRSIIGGYVYRGCEIATLNGHYIFGDYISTRIWTFDDPRDLRAIDRRDDLFPSRDGYEIARLTSFGEDARGELYIADLTGSIFKIVPREPTIRTGDYDCDGLVDFADLLAVLSEWGPCDGCREDINGDDDVNFVDLLLVLSNWG